MATKVGSRPVHIIDYPPTTTGCRHLLSRSRGMEVTYYPEKVTCRICLEQLTRKEMLNAKLSETRPKSLLLFMPSKFVR